MILTIIILSIITISLTFALVNILRKYEKLEDENDYVNNYVNDLLIKLKKTILTMKDIDVRGSFESDDETGAIFGEIKNMIIDIEKNYLIEEDIDAKEKK